MPCRSYEDEYREEAARINTKLMEKELRDKLARISCISLTAIEELYALMPNDQKEGTHIGEMLKGILENKDVIEWWPAHKEADAFEKKRQLEIERRKEEAKELKRKKDEILSRMSPEDKRLLGLE
jgi:hypothetical protein